MANSSFRRFVLPEIMFGNGVRALAGRYARGFDARKVLLVSDPGVKAAGWTDKVGEVLREAGMECVEFLEVSPNPRDFQIAAGTRLCVQAGCDLIVAVGGGSPMDCAKGIAVCATNGRSVLDYEGVDRIPQPGLPLICVPTTAGTSADVSQFAIVNDTGRRVKIALISKKTVPDAALIDPEATSTMPPELTAATGMDALCHAAEAYVSLGASPLTDLPALRAAWLVGRWLPAAYKAAQRGCLPPAPGREGTSASSGEACAASVEAREGMMLASLLAGEAFSNASLGLVHAMAHSLGGLLDAPHGLCNAILLDRVALANVEAGDEAAGRADARYAELAEAMMKGQAAAKGERKEGVGPRPGAGAEAFAEAVAGLRRELGLDKRLSELGMKADDIPGLAGFAFRDPCLATNPRKIGAAEIERIYERAL